MITVSYNASCAVSKEGDNDIWTVRPRGVVPLLPLCCQIDVGATVNALLGDIFSRENNTHGSRFHDRDPQFASRILGAMTQSCYIGTRDIRSRVIRGPYCNYKTPLPFVWYFDSSRALQNILFCSWQQIMHWSWSWQNTCRILSNSWKIWEICWSLNHCACCLCYSGPPVPFLDCQIDGLVQERRNSSAVAIELRLSCTDHQNAIVQWCNHILNILIMG